MNSCCLLSPAVAALPLLAIILPRVSRLHICYNEYSFVCAFTRPSTILLLKREGFLLQTTGKRWTSARRSQHRRLNPLALLSLPTHSPTLATMKYRSFLPYSPCFPTCILIDRQTYEGSLFI
uniref:Putative secreted peptide n=1 Tax=Anopheles braziliensis TaxID=58242 RepID=A0A2M3ZUZ4_9DIPT